MITTIDDEKKKPVITATVPEETKVAHVVAPIQEITQSTPSDQAQDQTTSATGNEAVSIPVGKHSTRISASIPAMLGERMAGANARMEAATQQFQQAAERYRDGSRNPLADIVLARQKPTRNIDEETRLRQNAKLQALGNMISLVGKGVAATGGYRPGPIDNRPIYDIRNRLQGLDDIYRQEGLRYDQNTLMAALRKDQAKQAAAQAEMSAAIDARKAAQNEINRLGDSVIKWGMSEEERAFKAAQNEEDRKFKAGEGAKDRGARIQAARISAAARTANNKFNKPLYRVNLRGNPVDVTTELRADVLNWGRNNGYETQINDVGNILGTNSLQEQQLMQKILPEYEKYIVQQDASYGKLIETLSNGKQKIEELTKDEAATLLIALDPTKSIYEDHLTGFIETLQRNGIMVK